MHCMLCPQCSLQRHLSLKCLALCCLALECASVLAAASGLPRGRRAQQKQRYKQHRLYCCSTDIYISSTGGSSSTVHKVALLPVLPVKTAQRQPSPSFTAQLVSQLAKLKMRDELWTVVGQKCVCRVVQHTISATQC